MNEYSEARQQNLGYALIVNELDIILSNANYNLKYSIADNIYDLEHYLTENTNIEDSNKLMDQIEQQWYDYKNEGYHVAPHEINYLMEVTINAYLQNKDINTYEDLMNAKENFIRDLTKGVKYAENLDLSEVDNVFNNIMNEKGLSGGLTK